MSNNKHSYIFIDESGDPGRLYKIDSNGDKQPTGASLFYILSAVCLDSKKLFLAEHEIMKVKGKYGFKSEIKSTTIPLVLYKDLLKIINKLDIKVYYRLIDKKKYTGQFAIPGKKNLHNVFDEYNLAKLVKFSIQKCGLVNTEVVIDRADRRLLDRNFENFNHYLMSKVNTKTIKKISHVTHVNSEYVHVMQMSDLVSGALKDSFTKKNTDLKKIINKRLLCKIW